MTTRGGKSMPGPNGFIKRSHRIEELFIICHGIAKCSSSALVLNTVQSNDKNCSKSPDFYIWWFPGVPAIIIPCDWCLSAYLLFTTVLWLLSYLWEYNNDVTYKCIYMYLCMYMCNNVSDGWKGKNLWKEREQWRVNGEQLMRWRNSKQRMKVKTQYWLVLKTI